MKKEKIRKFVLKDYTLRRLRANLRSILYIVVESKWKYINTLYCLYLNKITPTRKKLTPSQEKRMKTLNQEKRKLFGLLFNSMLYCSHCTTVESPSSPAPFDVNMVSVPDDGFYCEKCYAEYIIGYDPRKIDDNYEDYKPYIHEKWELDNLTKRGITLKELIEQEPDWALEFLLERCIYKNSIENVARLLKTTPQKIKKLQNKVRLNESEYYNKSFLPSFFRHD